MLDIAKRRATRLASAVQFQTLDAHRLTTIETASIDLYSMSLGMKICDRKLALAEAWRVLRPGGTFICLEASEIPVRFLHRAYLTYMKLCMPVVGWAATGGDTSAYDYLLKGVCGFPGAQKFADEITAQGFVEVTYERLSLGIVAIHFARKPDSEGCNRSTAASPTMSASRPVYQSAGSAWRITPSANPPCGPTPSAGARR
jgi:demethylmenaquinone methyltransferase / 2-methoxy-6-polyprenyl-1,4-benzoquinol methylase